MPTATPADPAPVRVLLVDDDRDDYLLTRDLLDEVPGGRYVLHWEGEYQAGLDALCSGEHDLALIDYRLGARTGLELMAAARERGGTTPVILLTGQGRFEIDQAAIAAGAADYLEKGKFDAVVLERAIRYALIQKGYEADLERQVAARTEAMNAANAELRAADRRKDEFLATLAHELRNPLAPIRNAVEILRLAGTDPEAVDQCRDILARQVGVMVRLIDDLLDVSRITRDKLHLNREPIDLRDVLIAAVETSRPLLDRAGVALRYDWPAAPLRVAGDRVRLTQVFANLLNNAGKYTDRGGRVTLAAAPEGGLAVVRVADTGIGIAAADLPRVFDLFAQVGKPADRAAGGLGIGLALVKRLAEMHGGAVAAASPGAGRGSEFAVRLPLVSS
jgi:signal transduction histidine kinase